jgi:hypothetical protein
VAGTAVLGARAALAGWTGIAVAMLGIAIVLTGYLARALLVARPRPRTGAAFLLTVAPQSLAVLTGLIAGRLSLRWLAAVALAPFACGLVTYVAVLKCFDLRQLRVGAGDHWVSGGALAITTLACAEIARAIGASRTTAEVTSVALWAATIAWLPVLIGAEIRWPRPRYDIRRWATVFPLGMYSVSTYAVGAATGWDARATVADAMAWSTLAAWVAATAGALRSATLLRPTDRRHRR